MDRIDNNGNNSALRDLLLRQFDISWGLTSYHLDSLNTEECLWRPAEQGMHVHHMDGNSWRADWPDRETYDLGPPSIAWITWHIGFWWSAALDAATVNKGVSKDDILWPGSAEATREWLVRLQEQWRALLMECTDKDLASSERSCWPLQDRPFTDIVAWANVELMKNGAEIGLLRFLYAVRDRR